MKFIITQIFLAQLITTAVLCASDINLSPSSCEDLSFRSCDSQQAHRILDELMEDMGESMKAAVIVALLKQRDAATAYQIVSKQGRLKRATQWCDDESGQNILTITESETLIISKLNNRFDPLHSFLARWNSLNDGIPNIYDVSVRSIIGKLKKKAEYFGTRWLLRAANITETVMDEQGRSVTADYKVLLLYNGKLLEGSFHGVEIEPRRIGVFLRAVKKSYPDIAIYKL